MNDELRLEDDGDIAIDWSTDAPQGDRDMLTLSLRADGRLSYAWLFSNGACGNGVSYLPPEAFMVLRKLVPNVKHERLHNCPLGAPVVLGKDRDVERDD